MPVRLTPLAALAFSATLGLGCLPVLAASDQPNVNGNNASQTTSPALGVPTQTVTSGQPAYHPAPVRRVAARPVHRTVTHTVAKTPVTSASTPATAPSTATAPTTGTTTH